MLFSEVTSFFLNFEIIPFYASILYACPPCSTVLLAVSANTHKHILLSALTQTLAFRGP